MKLCIVRFVIAVFVAIVMATPLDARRVDYDSGPIETMSDGFIYVRGNSGMHVLEPVGVCLWCEPGLQVLVTFIGFTRATLKPFSRRVRARPLKVLVIKDGRDQL
jgi:hypothetical protein